MDSSIVKEVECTFGSFSRARKECNEKLEQPIERLAYFPGIMILDLLLLVNTVEIKSEPSQSVRRQAVQYNGSTLSLAPDLLLLTDLALYFLSYLLVFTQQIQEVAGVGKAIWSQKHV